MKKVFLALAIFSLGASSAFAWGHPYLNSQQNWQNYHSCVDAATNGSDEQKILSNWACEKFYGVATNNKNDGD